MAKTWAMVERYFETKGDECGSCPYAKMYSQSHPYGMGSATEEWMECGLMELSVGVSPEDCPGIAGWDEEEVEEVTAAWPFPKGESK